MHCISFLLSFILCGQGRSREIQCLRPGMVGGSKRAHWCRCVGVFTTRLKRSRLAPLPLPIGLGHCECMPCGWEGASPGSTTSHPLSSCETRQPPPHSQYIRTSACLESGPRSLHPRALRPHKGGSPSKPPQPWRRCPQGWCPPRQGAVDKVTARHAHPGCWLRRWPSLRSPGTVGWSIPEAPSRVTRLPCPPNRNGASQSFSPLSLSEAQ